MDYLDPDDYGGENPNGSRTCSQCGSSMTYDFQMGCWFCNNSDCGGH
jgi:hypothetical protein